MMRADTVSYLLWRRQARGMSFAYYVDMVIYNKILRAYVLGAEN